MGIVYAFHLPVDKIISTNIKTDLVISSSVKLDLFAWVCLQMSKPVGIIKQLKHVFYV